MLPTLATDPYYKQVQAIRQELFVGDITFGGALTVTEGEKGYKESIDVLKQLFDTLSALKEQPKIKTVAVTVRDADDKESVVSLDTLNAAAFAEALAGAEKFEIRVQVDPHEKTSFRDLTADVQGEIDAVKAAVNLLHFAKNIVLTAPKSIELADGIPPRPVNWQGRAQPAPRRNGAEGVGFPAEGHEKRGGSESQGVFLRALILRAVQEQGRHDLLRSPGGAVNAAGLADFLTEHRSGQQPIGPEKISEWLGNRLAVTDRAGTFGTLQKALRLRGDELATLMALAERLSRQLEKGDPRR